ncbi:hypothetical protein MHK_007752, partial [Candidatus Magnetomorum sp. HK-1]
DQYTIDINPVSNESGTSTISINIIDAAGLTASTSFNLDVTEINDLPVIADIANQNTSIDQAISIPIQLTEIEGDSLTITYGSSNTNVVPSSISGFSFAGDNISFDGSIYTISSTAGIAENLTLIVNPNSGQAGATTINFTVNDGNATTNKSFQLSVDIFNWDESISLTGINRNSIAPGDYDNDADMDVLITGDTGSVLVSTLYRNTGTHLSENYDINTVGSRNNAIAFADYNHDGYLDILITGTIDGGKISQLYRNTGTNFTEDAILTSVSASALAFFDYDNDGDLDILLTGSDTSNTRIARIFRNTNGTFSHDTGISLPGVADSAVACGDIDNDGDQDFIITGDNNGTYISKLYRNTGGGFSNDTGLSFPGIAGGSVAFGDYDNDGYLDLLLVGFTNSSTRIAKLYRNNGGSFTEN